MAILRRTTQPSVHTYPQKGGSTIAIIEEIYAHGKEVLSASNPPTACPKCNNNHHQSFKLHQKRIRIFLVIRDSLVEKIRSLLGRWKCLCCNKTFTVYPGFTYPYKQYVNKYRIELGQTYLQKSHTYMSVVHPFLHKEARGMAEEPVLEGSTVWRWLSFIDSLKPALRKAIDLIKKKSPATEVLRKTRFVHPGRYRSPQRKKVLQQCMLFFDANEEYQQLFGVSIFPTLCNKG